MQAPIGWVLSDPVSSENCSSTPFCFATHSMRCDVTRTGKEVDELRSDLMRFWSAETVGKSDECVIHQFEKKIFHNGERYVTKLPFKSDHDDSANNFKVSEARLSNLRRRLKDKKLTSDYNAIIKDYERDGRVEIDTGIAKPTGLVYYLPHRPVYSDPKLLSKIFDILLKVQAFYSNFD